VTTGNKGAQLKFDYKGLTNSPHGYLAVEYSLNGGSTWFHLQKDALSNFDDNDYWVSNQVYELPANEKVNVRFTCNAGGVSNLYFCAIDQVEF
jgi:hypothetical protein